ncbi:MAG: endonuclease/exonuclease/phosphatase family protein [Paludibacteraceae bacterium]|nr:endonuclease/exonuclease/phosphatase family protein [Paludibacteraceae bacterium]
MRKTLVIALMLAAAVVVSAQKKDYSVRAIGFYNLENLFDTIHDEGKNDSEYLPDGGMHWTGLKYKHKLHNMSYALSQLGTDHTPEGCSVIGVAEVENIGCLEDLCREPEMAARGYKPILLEGPDRRGVDVGLLYNPKHFQPMKVKGYVLKMKDDRYDPNGDTIHTRFELLVSGYLDGEKIHVIVNHWPSRWGGEEYSRPRRVAAAELLLTITDSLYRKDPKSKIIIMGDLNDDPDNVSCAQVINAQLKAKNVAPQGFYNTMWPIFKRGIGTLMYNGSWNLFDQIMISEPLLNAPRTEWSFWKPEVFNKEFLVQQDGQGKGGPLRTHAGGTWLNGYADHFPTLIYLVKEKK